MKWVNVLSETADAFVLFFKLLKKNVPSFLKIRFY